MRSLPRHHPRRLKVKAMSRLKASQPGSFRTCERQVKAAACHGVAASVLRFILRGRGGGKNGDRLHTLPLPASNFFIFRFVCRLTICVPIKAALHIPHARVREGALA